MIEYSRRAAGLLEKAARLALATEFDKAIHTMDLALTEIQHGLYLKYIQDNMEDKQ